MLRAEQTNTRLTDSCTNIARMNTVLAVLLIAIGLSLSSTAFAAHPLATEDTGTAGIKKFQVETSAAFGWEKETSNHVTTESISQALNVGITAGLLDPLDLVLTFPFSWQQVKEDGLKTHDHGGLNDLSLALKWRFLEIGPASLAIKPSISFPSGDYNHGLGAGRPKYGATLVTTAEFKPVAIHANIGYTLQKSTDKDRDAIRENIWNLSLAGTYEVRQGLQLVAEISTASNAGKLSSTWPTSIAGGVIYSAIENLDLSLGIRGGLTPPETDIALLTGITFKYP